MASLEQTDANRLNALKSTGPRSAEGKAKSRLNAIRDNITGQIITLSDKDRPIFEDLKAKLIAGFDPQTPLEHKLAHDIAWDSWRLDHLRAIEMNVYALGMEELENADLENEAEGPATSDPNEFDTALADARTFRSEAKRFELMSLYEQRMNRTMHRNLATLRDLQAERKRNYERDKKEEIQIARLLEFNDMPIKASTLPSKSGFLYSDAEIAIGTVRQRYLDTAACVLKTTNPAQLYGTLRVAGGLDSLMQKVADTRPLSEEERNIINSVSPEVIALRRQTHPEEFGIRKQ